MKNQGALTTKSQIVSNYFRYHESPNTDYASGGAVYCTPGGWEEEKWWRQSKRQTGNITWWFCGLSKSWAE